MSRDVRVDGVMEEIMRWMEHVKPAKTAGLSNGVENGNENGNGGS